MVGLFQGQTHTAGAGQTLPTLPMGVGEGIETKNVGLRLLLYPRCSNQGNHVNQGNKNPSKL